MIWLLWLIIGISILFFLGTVFYKQTIQEYRINQVDWSNRSKLIDLWEERIPIVIRDSPVPPIWTFDDIEARQIYRNFTIDTNAVNAVNAVNGANAVKPSVKEWTLKAAPDAVTVWNKQKAVDLAAAADFEPWIKTIWLPSLEGLTSWMTNVFPMKPHFWAGSRGLLHLKANWTLIFPTESSIILTLLTEKENSYLPTQWENTFPRKYTNADTPYVSSIQYIDVILRPGHSILVPAHWKIAWENDSSEAAENVPLVCMIDIHSPISWINDSLTAPKAAAVAAAAFVDSKKQKKKPKRQQRHQSNDE
jgi:hypothetical protein